MGGSIASTIDDLLEACDVVMLETNYVRMHVEQATQVIKARQSLFMDKPVAAVFSDVKAIFKLAEEYGVAVFSSSALRLIDDFRGLNSPGKITGADTLDRACTNHLIPPYTGTALTALKCCIQQWVRAAIR